MESISKVLISVGILLIFLGLCSQYLGKLPGDIIIKKEKFSFYFPLTTCLVISLFFFMGNIILSWFKKF